MASFLRVLFLASLFLFPAAGSFAAVFDVTDSTELRNALTTAQGNGEADTINIAAGTYSAGGTPFAYAGASGENFSLTLDGAGAGTTFLDGGDSTQVLNINTEDVGFDPDADVTIRGLTIQNGSNTVPGGGGGLSVITNSASIAVEGCSISDNSTDALDGDGGGANVLTFGGGDITLTNNTFADNSAGSFDFIQGGGVQAQTVDGGDVTLTNNMFVNNSVFTNDSLFAEGGGAFIVAIGDLTMTNNTFVNNSADAPSGDSSAGGAFVAAFDGALIMTNNTLKSSQN